jgi:hypothetical protein
MGLLDDAIREHLELKRRRGADAGEVSREESEALGPVRRSPDGTPDLSTIPAPPTAGEPATPSPPAHDLPARDDEPDWGDEAVAHTPPPIPAQPPPSYPEPPAAGYVMPPALPELDPAFDDDEPLPPLDELDPEPQPQRGKRRLPGAGRLRLRRGRGEPLDDPPTAAHDRPHEPAPTAYQPPATDEPAGEDLLEETPEFLEETPDHDRLWFEQRPPRDFDFDK